MNAAHCVWETSAGPFQCAELGGQEFGCDKTGQQLRVAQGWHLLSLWLPSASAGVALCLEPAGCWVPLRGRLPPHPAPLDSPPAGTPACSSVLAGLLEEGQGALCVSVSGGPWGLGDAARPREVGGSKSLSPGPMSAPLPWG